MSARLFVGNLNPKTTKPQIASFLSSAGRVMSVALPIDRNTDRPRGFAFVEFADREGAEMALEICDGRDLDGYAVRLSWARERDEGDGERFRGGGTRRGGSVLADEEDAGRYGGREPSGSGRRGEAFEDDEGDRGTRRHRHGKHGSDRKRGRGTRRVIE